MTESNYCIDFTFPKVKKFLDVFLRPFRMGFFNNPKKIVGLNGYGLTVHDIVKIPPFINKYNKRYMETKKDKMHHMI